MSLHHRLKRLEGRKASHYTGPPPELLVFMKQMNNAQRELQGLEPEPLTPEEERIEYESDKRFLEEVAPEY